MSTARTSSSSKLVRVTTIISSLVLIATVQPSVPGMQLRGKRFPISLFNRPVDIWQLNQRDDPKYSKLLHDLFPYPGRWERLESPSMDISGGVGPSVSQETNLDYGLSDLNLESAIGEQGTAPEPLANLFRESSDEDILSPLAQPEEGLGSLEIPRDGILDFHKIGKNDTRKKREAVRRNWVGVHLCRLYNQLCFSLYNPDPKTGRTNNER